MQAKGGEVENMSVDMLPIIVIVLLFLTIIIAAVIGMVILIKHNRQRNRGNHVSGEELKKKGEG